MPDTEVLEAFGLANAESLAQRVQSVCSLRPDMKVTVGVASARNVVCIEYEDGKCHESEVGLVRIGCLSKLFLPALASGILGREGLLAEGVLRTCSELRDAGRSELDSITFQNLIDHTHGLDTTTINSRSLRENGYLDCARLFEQTLHEASLSRPGALHSYSNASAWMAAAVLEAVTDRPFGQLLDEYLSNGISTSGAACPATGEELLLGGRAFLEFLASHWTGRENERLLAFAAGAQAIPLPGWSGSELGICSGWKWYGNGSFGHNSAHKGAYGVVRVDTQRELAFFALSRTQPCNSIAAALFARLMPSLIPSFIPKFRENGADEHVDRYVGTYCCAATVVFIRADEESQLHLFAHNVNHDGRSAEHFYSARLRAAENHVFYTQPRHAELFPHVQFVEPTPDGFGYLWNGKHVWRKFEAQG